MQLHRQLWTTLGRPVVFMAAALALALPARATAQTVTFTATDNDSGTSSYGVLNTSANGDGSYTATGGYLIILNGPIAGKYDLFPNPNAPKLYFYILPGGNSFAFDNQLFPGESPTLDGLGLLFTGGTLAINISGNPGAPYSFFYFDTANPGQGFVGTKNASFTLASTPVGIIEGLQTVVLELVTSNDLAANNAQPLQAKLSAALASANRGNSSAAEGQLTAFINQVHADIKTGKISQTFGQSLIDQANAAIAALGG
jgi:hypothetical protein